MKVSLVSLTQAAGMTPEHLIIYTARVSSPHRQEDHESAPRLLRYLISHGHWSPFEMVDMTVEIETSRAVASQIQRHRSFSFQEFSQRYSDVSALGFEKVEPRRQDLKNRQNSTDDLDESTREWFQGGLGYVQENAAARYEMALKMGIAKESARFLLPLSVTTRLYMKGSVRSWIHYLKARTAPETQKEHRDVSLAILNIFRTHFPNTAEAAL